MLPSKKGICGPTSLIKGPARPKPKINDTYVVKRKRLLPTVNNFFGQTLGNVAASAGT